MKRYTPYKLILSFFLLASYFSIAQNPIFSSVAGQEAAFNAKYKLEASIDEATMTLKFSTDAPISKAILSVYTATQLAVRKGTDHTYPFTTPVHGYSFNLDAPAYKGFLAYWLKVYTADGLFQEYFFKRKEKPAAKDPLPRIGDKLEKMEKKDKDGFTIINTNIKCAAGKTSVYNALKSLDGVEGLTIDIKTGKLLIKYSSDGTPYTTILSTINENGFDANGQKATTINPCAIIKVIPVDDTEKKDANGFTVINTNINCTSGKTKVYNALKGLDGVQGLTIDIKTGKLLIKYSSDGTPYTDILKTITENGFIANGHKPSKLVPNPCSTKID